MKQCLIYENSLRFARAISGVLLLIAFLIKNYWLVLAVSILMFLAAFSMKLNVVYQFHILILRKLLKRKLKLIEKELGELNFTSGMTGTLLLVAFLFLYFGKFIDFAWILILIISLLLFLACFVGFCVVTLMYAFLKNFFKK